MSSLGRGGSCSPPGPCIAIDASSGWVGRRRTRSEYEANAPQEQPGALDITPFARPAVVALAVARGCWVRSPEDVDASGRIGSAAPRWQCPRRNQGSWPATFQVDRDLPLDRYGASQRQVALSSGSREPHADERANSQIAAPRAVTVAVTKGHSPAHGPA
jgi:hypothetical protein